MKDLVEYIVKGLVDNPDEVTVTEMDGERTSVIELGAPPEDLGKIIGKQGRTIRAIRTVMAAASAKKGKRAVLDILEEED
ncbi:MAG: KH domain-containing protein [Candidatus Methylomirabilis sp.]|nr:KH domain-containing protein [Deltaproteobacteria bacterium]